MGKHYFTDKEVQALNKNKYVKKVSNKAITYTDEFKVHVILELESGKSAKLIFHESGFNVYVLKERRIKSAVKRWKELYNDGGCIWHSRNTINGNY